jgi:hypothetical protein
LLIFKGLPRVGWLFAVGLLKAVPGRTCVYYAGAEFTGSVPDLFRAFGVLGNYRPHIMLRKEDGFRRKRHKILESEESTEERSIQLTQD